jgi:Zn finger protein HypA/HybF involved in hydrogenase expression
MMNENDSLDMTIRIMDKLSEMKVLNKKQSADKDFAIQDAITQEIEVVFNRISLKDQIDNNSISIGEFHNKNDLTMNLKQLTKHYLTKIKKAEKIFQEGGIYICPMCDGECQFCDDDYQCSECEKEEERVL